MDDIDFHKIFAFICFAVFCLCFYFFPTWAAYKLNHKNLLPILVLNLLLGWTGLGWIGALIWALCR